MSLWDKIKRHWLPEPMRHAFGDPALAPLDRALLGAHAKRLLDDPVLTLAFEKVDKELVNAFRRSAPAEERQRTAIYAEMWALKQVEQHLRVFFGNLQLIEAERKLKEAEAARQGDRRERQV